MSAPAATSDGSGNRDLAQKIAKLVEEKGWNQEDFAKACQLNRHTVRQILNSGPQRRLRNATVGSCANALGLTVNELRTLPLERLLPRMGEGHPAHGGDAQRRLYDHAHMPELSAWLDRNPDRARKLMPDEIDEILALQ